MRPKTNHERRNDAEEQRQRVAEQKQREEDHKQALRDAQDEIDRQRELEDGESDEEDEDEDDAFDGLLSYEGAGGVGSAAGDGEQRYHMQPWRETKAGLLDPVERKKPTVDLRMAGMGPAEAKELSNLLAANS